MSNKSRIPTSPHTQSFTDLYDDDNDYYSNNEDFAFAMAVPDPLNHSSFLQMDQQYTYHRPEYDQDHFIPNPNDKKSHKDSLSSHVEDVKNQTEPQLNQVTTNENKVNDYSSNIAVTNTQDNATNTITSAASNCTATSTHNTATDIHGTSILTRDAAADFEHTTHISQEVCDKNAPLVDNDKIKPNVTNDIIPVATELNPYDNASTSGIAGAAAKKEAGLKANKKNTSKGSAGSKRKTSQAKLSNDNKEGEPNKTRRSSRGKVSVKKADDFMEEDLVSTEQVDITVPTKRKYAKAKGKAVKSSSTSSDSSTINDLQNISYLLTNRNSFLTHESIKDNIQDWLLHLSKEEKTELAKMLPQPDLDNGKWNEDLAFLDGLHFWEAFQQWQEILFLGGFEETFKTEIETSDDNTFKDENYEAFWGEKLK